MNLGEPGIRNSVNRYLRMEKQTNRSRGFGFTIIELVLVVAIILTLTAIAVPPLPKVIAASQIRGGMGDLSGLFQNARNIAVRQNTISRVRFQSTSNRWTAYIDNGANPTGLTTTTPRVVLPPQFKKVSPPSGGTPSAISSTTCGSGTSLDTTDGTYFSQTGSPCVYSGGVCTTSQAFTYYFTYSENSSNPNWAALCISPAGRLKAWYWTGGAWTN